MNLLYHKFLPEYLSASKLPPLGSMLHTLTRWCCSGTKEISKGNLASKQTTFISLFLWQKELEKLWHTKKDTEMNFLSEHMLTLRLHMVLLLSPPCWTHSHHPDQALCTVFSFCSIPATIWLLLIQCAVTSTLPPTVIHRTVPGLQYYYGRASQVCCERTNRIILRHQKAAVQQVLTNTTIQDSSAPQKKWCLPCQHQTSGNPLFLSPFQSTLSVGPSQRMDPYSVSTWTWQNHQTTSSNVRQI